ncbi:MAG: glycosyltransferase [Akkermansiaceae bacterium]
MQSPNNKPVKVMHLVADVLPGGAEVLMAQIIKQQSENGRCESVVVTLEAHGEANSLRPELESVAGFHNLECRSFFSSDFRDKFKALLLSEKPDVIHAWSYDCGLVAGAIARFSHGVKVVWAIHSMDLPSRHEYSWLRFNTLKLLVGIGSRIIPHKIISCSDVATDAHVKFGYPRKRCMTIPNGVDTGRFQTSEKAAEKTRESLGIPDEAPIVGYLGRSHPVKRLEDFFAAVEILMQKHNNLHVVALGFDKVDLYPEAKTAYENLSDPARVHILGSRQDVEQFLPAFSVNLLTSSSEAMPMVLMEAMSCGVPCVSTDVGSASEIIDESGALVEVGNPQALAGATEKLLSESDAKREQARAAILENFCITKTERLHSELYQQLAGRGTENPKVIHLVNDLDFGGAQTILHRLAKGLHGKDFHQKVISVLPLGRLAPGFSESGIKVDTLNVRGLISGLAGVLRMAKMIRREKPDILQTWMFHSALIGEIASLLAFRRTKVLWSIHHTKLGKESSKMTTRIIQRTLAFLSSFAPERIIYCSKSSLDLHHADGFAEKKSELIFNGTDESYYSPDDAACKNFRNEYGIPADAPLVGMAGRYHPQKDFANLLKAFALVQKEIPAAHLVACGPDVTRDTSALKELADCCPFPNQVHLIGPRLDMEKVYPALTIAALSSCEGEAFPLVLGEAMSCEVPCVATDVGDSALIIGDTGRVVQPRDHQALAAATIELLAEDLFELGDKARLRVISEFSLSRYVEAHASLYREITTNSQAERTAKMAAAVNEKPQPISH